ncbi:MAG: hypothetical protein BWY06_00759 [Candidatus Latescibacteria bacterium ADurb.Bin168]|nr:MAG: hypothetical protein BWY06_00759 [Candidatus Latescibacteria bacterium ADurb.Bin168]
MLLPGGRGAAVHSRNPSPADAPLGAVFRHHVHHAGAHIPVFRVEATRQKRHLGHQSLVELRVRFVCEAVRSVETVHLEAHLCCAASADIQFCIARKRNAGFVRQYVQHLVHRNFCHAARVHCRLGGRYVRLDGGPACRYDDGFNLDGFLLQGEIQCRRPIRRHPHVLRNRSAESHHARLNFVDAGGNLQDEVAPLGIGDAAEPQAGNLDSHPGNWLPAGLAHGAGDFPRGAGAQERNARENQRRSKKEPAAEGRRAPNHGTPPGEQVISAIRSGSLIVPHILALSICGVKRRP